MLCGYAPLKFDLVEEVGHGPVQFPNRWSNLHMRGYEKHSLFPDT